METQMDYAGEPMKPGEFRDPPVIGRGARSVRSFFNERGRLINVDVLVMPENVTITMRAPDSLIEHLYTVGEALRLRDALVEALEQVSVPAGDTSAPASRSSGELPSPPPAAN